MSFLFRRETEVRSGNVSSPLFGLLFFAVLLLSHNSPAYGASVTLAWDAPASGSVTGYKIYRRVENQEYTLLKTIGNVTQYLDATLAAGTKYYYAVKAYNSYGDSGYSNELPYTATTSTNRAPVASNGSLTVTEDSIVTSTTNRGTLSATDADGNPLTFSIVAQGSKGTAAITNASTGAFTYTPSPNANGSDVFSFKASDGSLSSNTASVSVTISPVNDPPVATDDSAQTLMNQPVTVGVLANDTDVDGDTLSVQSFTQPSKGKTTANGNAITYTPSQGFTGDETFSYTVIDGKGGTDTGSVTVKVSADGSTNVNTQQVVMAINAGGAEYTAADGTVYQADDDAYYSGGTARTTSTSIYNTSDDPLYQSRRSGTFTYDLPAANGNYTLTLKFAEVYYTSAGQRVFDVFVEDREVADSLDIFAKAGAGSKAYDITVPVTVQDGSVSIRFGSITGSPQLNAILLTKATQLTRLGVNSGGDRFAAYDGQVYEADSGFSGGGTYSTTASISGTLDDTLYRSERYGNFTYSLPVVNGEYYVTLKFAEIYWDKRGRRVFDVWIEGVKVISSLDLFAQVGQYAPYDHREWVYVTDGKLDITFSSVEDNAKVSAILVEPAH